MSDSSKIGFLIIGLCLSGSLLLESPVASAEDSWPELVNEAADTIDTVRADTEFYQWDLRSDIVPDSDLGSLGPAGTPFLNLQNRLEAFLKSGTRHVDGDKATFYFYPTIVPPELQKERDWALVGSEIKAGTRVFYLKEDVDLGPVAKAEAQLGKFFSSVLSGRLSGALSGVCATTLRELLTNPECKAAQDLIQRYTKVNYVYFFDPNMNVWALHMLLPKIKGQETVGHVFSEHSFVLSPRFPYQGAWDKVVDQVNQAFVKAGSRPLFPKVLQAAKASALGAAPPKVTTVGTSMTAPSTVAARTTASTTAPLTGHPTPQHGARLGQIEDASKALIRRPTADVRKP